MKVLFVYTNINGYHDDTYSFGLASIVAITANNGHEVKVVIVHNKNEYALLTDEISKYSPRVVGFSSVSSQFNFVKELSHEVKKINNNIITVCGGVHPTICPTCIQDAPYLDGIFVGESEESFVEYLDKIDKGVEYKETRNYAYLSNEKVITNELRPLVKEIDKLPYPDRDNYNYLETINSTGFAPFIFSRGCPYLCSYCSNHAIAKAYGCDRNVPRFRSVDSSIQEIKQTIKKYPEIEDINIVDDIFGLNKAWRSEFCDKYKKLIGKKFVCLLRANVITEEFIKQLKSAGCYRIQIGLESGNPYVRNDIMNRNMTNEQIIKAFVLARKYGIETNAINIIGIPGETEDMIWDTIKLNRKVKPSSSGVNIFYPYKGTKLGDECFEKDIVDLDLYNSFSNERRATTLKYSEEYKEKLLFFYRNWDVLVYPYNIKIRIKSILKNTFLWPLLKKIKGIKNVS